MKHRFEKRILSLILCITMVLTIVITNANFAFSATYSDGAIGGSEYSEELENNIGKQAIFDWWDNFFIVDDPKREDIADIYMYTDVNSTYDDGENYWYLYEEKFYYDGTSTGQPFIDAYDVKMIITDYYYDNINGYHWYKVTGADLPEPLVEKPWILYALDADSEYGFDPTLCIYEIDETIRFVTTELKDYAIDGDGNYVLDENGNYIEEGIPLLNFYVFAGPMEIANAEISITSRNEDYPVSELSCMENTYGTIFSKAFDFTIDKAIGEEVDLWTPEDGMISIRYQSTMLPADTYKQDCYCGSAFMYVDDKLFCATSTERSIEISDLTYTNSGSSVLVIELLDETFFRERQPAYFVNDSVTLYDNNMQAAEFLAAQLPVTFTAECSFEDENGEEYYWLENKGFIGSPYFIAKADDVILDELPEEFGDGRVSITDKMGNSVSEITLPMYEKPEFTAISSLSLSTADVDYQWQIEYEDGEWVDIYGEDDKTIKISFGMVATLLNENGQCAIRCESKTSTMTAYSKPIVITLEMYEPKEPDVVVSESFVTSNGETVTVSVAGDIPEDASVALEETDSSGVDVNAGETFVAALDISIKNADGTEWQPESGETVKVELPATAVGLKNGDRFVVYHLHQGEVKVLGTYMVTNGTVAFDVDGFSKFVFALAVDTSNVDYAANVEGEAFFNPALYDESINTYNNVNITDKPENGINFSTDYVFNPQNHMDLRMIIEDYCLNGTGYWYKVKAADGYTLPAELEAKPWIYQNDIPTSNYANNLLIIPPAPKAPDFSGDLDKHAHFTYSADLYIEVSDVEPYAGVESMSYSRDQFSTDFTVMIDDYKVITVSSDIVDKNTGVVIGRSYVQSLWYKVNVVSGTCTDDFRDGFWVLQNYLTEGDEYPVDTLTLFDAPVVPDEPEEPEEPEEPVEPSVGITVNGETVNEITVSKSDKVTVTATPNVEGSMTYKWQILIPAANMWVNIFGQTAADCTVNYGMVANRLDSNGQAHIRCVTTIDGVEVISEPIAVNLVTTYSFFNNYWMPMYLSTPQSRAEGDAPSVSNPVTVTIQFVYGSNPDKLVAEPIRSTIQKGTPYTLLNYKLPEMEGYSAYYEDDTETIWTVIDIELEAVNEDVTITFKYWPAKVNYTVIYYWQNADNDNYTEHERFVLTDFTGNITTVEDKKYDGFYQLLYEKVPIASDGSTVIEVYYDRYYYLMLFNLDGGYGVQPVYARHGATLPTLAPKKAGCDFVGWDSDADDDNSVDSDFPKTMPIGDTNYTAIWQYSKDKVDVHIVVWGENPNDDEYSYIKSETLQVAPGTEINYKENILTCTIEEHVHSEACNFQCGMQEHTHSQANGCTLSCTHQHNISCVTSNGRTNQSPSSDDQSAIGDTTVGIQSGYVYKIEVSGDNNDYYYLRYDNAWYLWKNPSNNGADVVNGNALETITKNIKTGGILGIGGTTKTWTVTVYKVKYANCTHNAHTDACYTCDKTPHTHSDSCGYTCGKDYHKHNSGCYASDDLMESKLWTLVKSDTVTVAPDGSTIMNVYYDRTQFTMTFKEEGTNGDTLGTITDKWGASIMKRFEDISKANTFFWSMNQYGGSPWTSFMDIMPQENRTYYADPQSGTTTITAQYLAEKVDGSGYEVIYTVSFKGSSGITVTKEEFVDIEGFVFNDSLSTDIRAPYNGAKFYYDRASYKLQFHDNGETGVIDELTKTVVYGGSLAEYADITLDASDAPLKYEPGSVRFAGWYTNPEGAGEPFDFANTTMPAGPKDGDPSLILYAKWVPVTHTVRFYTDKQYVGTDTIYTNSNGDQYIYEVPHGSKIQDPLTPPADPTKGQYKFNGWYYIDAENNEQRWDFKNTTVTRNVDVYAKWSSNQLMPYTVRFVYKDGDNEITIADPITGSALGGNSKTFDAKGNEQLYTDYQEGYFPLVQSHTITIDLENTANNEFTFYYVKKDAVPYTVYYVTETPKDGDNLQQIKLDGKTYYMVAETETVSDNKKAIVTETYKSVAGYLPNNYQETLVINPDATADEPNRIIFIYSVDEKNSMYIVHYYFMDESGKNYVENPDYLFQSKAEINSNVEAAKLNVDNFTHNPNVIGTVLGGKIVKDQILHLHVYYDRNTYSYKVQYLEEGTSKVLSPEKIVTGSLWESLVTEKYITIPNYTLSSDEEVTIQIRKDTENPTVNIITFFYTENKVNLNYVIVGPDGTKYNVNQSWGELTSFGESVKVLTGKANGSTASVKSNVYKFVGWYSDPECKTRISDKATFVPTKEDGTLWGDGTTYYAKFEYNLTSLTIDKNFPKDADYSMDENQSFLFDVVEVDADGKVVEGGAQLRVTIHGDGQITIDGLTVGHYYKIIEKKDWSWRYGTCTPSSAIYKEVSADGWIIVQLTADASSNKVTFENERTKDQWLDGDSWCNNLFK